MDTRTSLSGRPRTWRAVQRAVLAACLLLTAPLLIDARAAAAPGTADTCDSSYVVGLRGSDEDAESLEKYETNPGAPVYSHTAGPGADRRGFGEAGEAVLAALLRQGARSPEFDVDELQVRGIRYPAIPVAVQDPQYIPRFVRSVKVGARQLTRELGLIAAHCSDAKVVLVGYSQGADVVSKAMGQAQRRGDQRLFSQVRKVLFIGDPSHRPIAAENLPARGQAGVATGSGLATAFGIADKDAMTFRDAAKPLVQSICLSGDLVCDTTTADLTELYDLATTDRMTHTSYMKRLMACPAVGGKRQRATTCGAQILFAGLGHEPTAVRTR